MRLRIGRAVSIGLALAAPAAGAQEARDCDLVRSELARPYAQPDGTRIVYVVRPIFRCDDGAEIRADSATLYEASGISEFFRNVFMRDGEQILRADHARYLERLGQLTADGAVRLQDDGGETEVTGEYLTLLRAVDGRLEDVMTMEGGQPSAVFTPLPEEPVPDSTGAVPEVREPKPVRLRAARIVFEGNSRVRAKGRVQLRQDSLDAYGDSLDYAQDEGRLQLFGLDLGSRRAPARMIAPAAEGDTMDLEADTLFAHMPGGVIERIDAHRRAVLEGAELRVRGPRIRLFFEERELESIVAVVPRAPRIEGVDDEPMDTTTANAAPEEAPPALSTRQPRDPRTPVQGLPQALLDEMTPPERPEAVAEEYTIVGDSVEIDTPQGSIETVFAAGSARAVSTARDSINTPDTPEVLLRDWIDGDSITAYFEADVVAADSTEAEPDTETRIRRIVATGNARSLSRFRPDSTQAEADTTGALNVNYVKGDEIRIFLIDGEVDEMEVDNADGMFLQPAARARVLTPADSTVAPPDSGVVRTDTTVRPPPDTMRRPTRARRGGTDLVRLFFPEEFRR